MCKYDNGKICLVWGVKLCERGFDCSEEKVEEEYFRNLER